MQIQLTTDNHIEGNAKLKGYVESLVESNLERFARRVTRVEVHLSGQNSNHKSGAKDIRCKMEARIAGKQPFSVTAEEESVDRALDGAITKLERALARDFDRSKNPKGRTSHAGEEP